MSNHAISAHATLISKVKVNARYEGEKSRTAAATFLVLRSNVFKLIPSGVMNMSLQQLRVALSGQTFRIGWLRHRCGIGASGPVCLNSGAQIYTCRCSNQIDAEIDQYGYYHIPCTVDAIESENAEFFSSNNVKVSTEGPVRRHKVKYKML